MATVKELNEQPKRLKCLRCQRVMETDRCHRICKKCHRHNNAQYVKDEIRTTDSGRYGVKTRGD